MRHLGDITKINGADVPVVDCIIGGSPCQDLSIAGKRAGLAGERSGLFMEQVRIVKEMRGRGSSRTNGDVRPRYMVWENVPGAFSSNRGRDFGAVLTEIVRIAEPEAPDLPVPEKGWTNAGAIVGDGWSVAWRVLDAQFWGVPQRRCRIALVADFGGQSAPEILFERKGLHGDTATCGAERKETAGEAETGVGSTVWCLQGNGIDRADTAGCNGKGWREDVSYTLNTVDRHAVAILDISHRGDVVRECGKTVPTMTSRMGTEGNNVPICMEGSYFTTAVDVSPALLGVAHKNAPCVTEGVQRVRRLTPMECERLQGYPDGWTYIGEWVDSRGKKRQTTKTARYKALGNSIALPPWKWVLKRICAQYERDATMASLFDGIGGFSLIWEQINGKGSCLWASEIEEFPMAVTKRRLS